MRSFFKGISSSHGNGKSDRKPNKHDANLQKNGWLRFQLGLLFSLGVAYFVIEATFAVVPPQDIPPMQLNEELQEYVMPDFTVEPEVKEKIKEPVMAKVLDPNQFDVIDDNAAVDETKEFINEPQPKPDLNLREVEFREEPEDVPVHVNFVQFVPVFPGCEDLETNLERKECMSDKINRIVRRNFDSSIAAEYGLTGQLRIDVQFKIDKSGNVTDVKVRAPHPGLEKEARRITSMIPQMKPGKQGGKDVEVIFMKPILFKVQ